MFRNLFSTYENTDPPPIITQDYKMVKDTYENYIEPLVYNLSNLDNKDNVTFSQYQPYLENQNLSMYMENNISKSNNQIVQYFVDKGLTLNQAKGIYGNLMQESGGNIKAVSTDGYNSYGIAQWTGHRKTRLFNKYGANPSIQNQLDFLWEELNTSEKKALDALKQTKTVEDATKVFMTKFERPNPKYANFNRRLQYANNA